MCTKKVEENLIAFSLIVHLYEEENSKIFKVDFERSQLRLWMNWVLIVASRHILVHQGI